MNRELRRCAWTLGVLSLASIFFGIMLLSLQQPKPYMFMVIIGTIIVGAVYYVSGDFVD